ncbi:MAG TPA: hypothetical protein VFF03_06330 [Rhodocyclaceae bacterium]|nr:hypothetical protein [Rhodocyclaceae bacterium]
MEDPTSKRIESTSSTGKGSGGDGGGKKPFQFNPLAPVFVPKPKAPLEDYVRTFETSTQRDFNSNPDFSHMPRARSYSIGVYDPNTNTRTNRSHFHVDPFRPDSGSPIAKPDAPGKVGGTFTDFQSTPRKL